MPIKKRELQEQTFRRPTFSADNLKPKLGGYIYYHDQYTQPDPPTWSEKRLAEEVSKQLGDEYHVLYSEIPRNGLRIYLLVKRIDRISVRISIPR